MHRDTETKEARRQWNHTFKLQKEKNYWPWILHPKKPYFKTKEEIRHSQERTKTEGIQCQQQFHKKNPKNKRQYQTKTWICTKTLQSSGKRIRESQLEFIFCFIWKVNGLSGGGTTLSSWSDLTYYLFLFCYKASYTHSFACHPGRFLCPSGRTE